VGVEAWGYIYWLVALGEAGEKLFILLYLACVFCMALKEQGAMVEKSSLFLILVLNKRQANLLGPGLLILFSYFLLIIYATQKLFYELKNNSKSRSMPFSIDELLACFLVYM